MDHWFVTCAICILKYTHVFIQKENKTESNKNCFNEITTMSVLLLLMCHTDCTHTLSLSLSHILPLYINNLHAAEHEKIVVHQTHTHKCVHTHTPTCAHAQHTHTHTSLSLFHFWVASLPLGDVPLHIWKTETKNENCHLNETSAFWPVILSTFLFSECAGVRTPTGQNFNTTDISMTWRCQFCVYRIIKLSTGHYYHNLFFILRQYLAPSYLTHAPLLLKKYSW